MCNRKFITLTAIAGACAGILASGGASAFSIAECPVRLASGATGYEPCVDFLLHKISGEAVTPAYPAMPSLGTTKAGVHAQFPKVILYNFTYAPGINASLATAADVYIARLSQQYVTEGGSVPALLEIAAKRLTAANLLRMQEAFGPAVTTAVLAYSSATVKGAYWSALAAHQTPLPRSHWLISIKGAAAPTLDFTLYEVWLDYYTSGLSATSSLAMTASYVGAWLSAAFTFGYAVGSGIYYIDDMIDPDINAAIGDEEGAYVNEVIDYTIAPNFGSEFGTDNPIYTYTYSFQP